ATLYSALTLFACSKVLDAVLAGVDYGQMVFVMSDHAETISKGIFKEMQRGVTGLQSVSLYHGKQKTVLLCVIRKVELPKLKKVVHELDKNAFMIVSDAREILGKGFKTVSF
ncbi:MAG: YitT family protein, partial [Clostridia bacterium]|nr:YitT family protein [Clostridia bacterium]